MNKTHLMFAAALVLSCWPTLLSAAAQTELTRFVSTDISVAMYDDNVHGQDFGWLFGDSRMKRLAIIITNSSSSRSAIAAHVRWKWVDVSGKPGELMQQHNGLLNNAGFVVNARARVLILPDGTATQAGQRMRGVASSLRVPPALMTALNVTVALDAIILADGEVIGPDQGGLVQELQGRAEAGAKVKDIIEAAQAQGRDPRLDIAKAAADPTLSSATRRYMVDLAHGGGRSGSLPVPRQIQLPNFYRK